MRGVFNPGKMSASLALFDNCSKGNCVVYVAFNFELLGKYTSLFDVPCFGKFISSGTKFDVAPESMTNFIAHRLSMRHVHLLVFTDMSGCCAAVTVLIAFIALRGIAETYDRDLNFIEED